MSRFVGILGIVFILGIAYLMSNNRKAINYKTIGMGFLLQILLAVFIFKVPFGQKLFMAIGLFIQNCWFLQSMVANLFWRLNEC